MKIKQKMEFLKNLKIKIIYCLAKILPDQCMLHIHIKFKGFTIVYIPSLCRINPWYHHVIEAKIKMKGYNL